MKAAKFFVCAMAIALTAVAQTHPTSTDNKLPPAVVARPEPVPSTSKPELAHIVDSRGGVLVKGVWEPDNPTKQNELVVTVVSLECYEHGGQDLVGTEAFCMQAGASSPTGMLMVDTEWLRVVEWSPDEIIAVDDSAVCVTSKTILDRRRKTVTAFDIRKPEAKGLLDMCTVIPDRQSYYLRDKVDYYFNHVSANAK